MTGINAGLPVPNIFVRQSPAMETQYKRTRIIRESSPVYWMGLVGAMVYFIQHASGFWMGVLAAFKAIVWPAICIYKLFDFFKT